MGNIIEIQNAAGDSIAEASQSLRCFAYFQDIAKKYNPDFNAFRPDTINDQLRPVYEKATKADEVVVLVFMNDENHFTAKDIPAFQEAIRQYPDGAYGNGPKRVLEKYLLLLKEHGELKTKFVGVSSSITIRQV